jgi:hypothetical protein
MTAQTPAPKAEDYSVVPGSLGPRRDFRISVGLREGWDADGRVFDVSEAVRTARAWMKRRVEAGQAALSPACSPVRKSATRGPAQTVRLQMRSITPAGSASTRSSGWGQRVSGVAFSLRYPATSSPLGFTV